MKEKELEKLGFTLEEKNPFTGKPQWNYDENISYDMTSHTISYRGGEYSQVHRTTTSPYYIKLFIEVLKH